MRDLWRKTAVMTALMLWTVAVPVMAAAEFSISVREVQGVVESRPNAMAPWSSIGAGTHLSPGAAVRTGSGASCLLVWDSGHVMRLQAFTNLEIMRLDTNPAGAETSSFKMDLGQINAHVERFPQSDSAFTVRTPSAVAGVRGTALFVNVAETGVSTFGVTEGQIFVESGGIEIAVMQDFVIVVDPAGVASPPEPMPAEMRQEAGAQIREARQQAGRGRESEATEEKKEEEEEAEEEAEKEEEAAGDDETTAATESDAPTPDETPATEAGADIAEAEAPELDEPVAPEPGVDTDMALDELIHDQIDDNISDSLDMVAEAQKTGQLIIDVYIDD